MERRPCFDYSVLSSICRPITVGYLFCRPQKEAPQMQSNRVANT